MRRADLIGLVGVAIVAVILSRTLSGGRLSLFTFVGLFAISAIGLSLLGGYAGQVSLGHAAFYGIGAYTSAIITSRYGISPWLGLLAALVVAGIVAALVGLPLLQLRGHYLTIGTLGFGIIATVIFKEWRALTGGPSGYPPLGGPTVAGFSLGEYTFTRRDEATLTWLAVLVAILLALNLVNSRVGRILRAIRGSEVAAATLGVAVWRYKLGVFVISAVYAAAAGALYAHQTGTVSPAAFTLTVSVEFLTMAAVGGLASVWGALVGAAAVQLLTDQIRDWLPRGQEILHRLLPAIPARTGGEQELIAFGLLLMLIMIFLPHGIAGGTAALLRLWSPRRGRGARPATVPEGEG